MTTFTKYETQTPPTKKTFMVYYQGFLAIAAVFIFFTKLDVYLGKQGYGIPLYWFILFVVAALPLLPSLPKRMYYIPKSILIWCGAYLAVPLISILISSQIPNLQLLEDQIRSIIFFLLMLLTFSQHTVILKWVKITILLVTIFNVLSFVYEFLNPLAFYVQQIAPGRASGFYGDANAASCATILGIIFSIDLIKPKYRLFFVLFTFLGIAVTFSRGGILGWGVVVCLLMLNNVIPRYQLPLFFISIFVATSIVSTQLNNLTYIQSSDGNDLFREDTIERVEFLVNPFGQEDDSSDSRLSYVDEAWRKFTNRPFIGNGLGSGANANHTKSDGTEQRSHNIYLDQMVEFGFLGALIYPFLLLSIVWKAQGEFKKYVLTFGIFLLIWGFFSHTTMSLFMFLTAYAIMGNMTKQNRLGNWQSK